jgi:hypothetical protein
MYLRVLYGSQHKERLFSYEALTDWFLQQRRNVFTTRYELCPLVYCRSISVLKGVKIFSQKLNTKATIMVKHLYAINLCNKKLSSTNSTHHYFAHIIHPDFLSLLIFVDSKLNDTGRNVQNSWYIYPSSSSRSEFKAAAFNSTGI